MKKSKFTIDIEKKLKTLTKTSDLSPFDPKKYIVGQSHSDLTFLKLRTADIKKLVHKDYVFKNMKNIWNETNIYEAMHITLYWLDLQSIEFLYQHQKEILHFSKRIDNWAHSDSLCCLLAKIFEYDSAYLLKEFTKFNQHKNLWLRRISMVSLFYYSSQRKKQPPFKLAQKFIENNILDKEYYVQKAIGWTLREMYNVYPKQALLFISKNILSISSVAWVAASEKLPTPTKQKLLLIRRKK